MSGLKRFFCWLIYDWQRAKLDRRWERLSQFIPDIGLETREARGRRVWCFQYCIDWSDPNWKAQLEVALKEAEKDARRMRKWRIRK